MASTVARGADIVLTELALSIGDRLKAHECGLEPRGVELDPEARDARCEPRAPRELTEHDLRSMRIADHGRIDPLEGLALLQHAVLMNSGRMAKCVSPDDGLVRRDHDSALCLDHFRHAIDS